MIRRVAICIALAAAVLAVYWPVLDHDFLNYDDDQYVTSNPQVRRGLSAEGVRWALTSFHASNWHPLTWISHMLDVELFGMNPRGHHAVGLLWHVLNSVLLFLVLERLTRATWRSAAVAALFALHPLHVESVAWIAERKDVLSTFFWILVLGAWARYAARPGRARYAIVALLLALGLTAKPMLVTLPLVLLLLDIWPLRRIDGHSTGRLVSEKLPLLGLCAASAAITLVAQRSGGALGTFEDYPLLERVGNALVAVATYLQKTIWPVGLAAFYPHPLDGLRAGPVVLSAALLLALTALALWQRRRRPWLLFGWVWFLVTLLPVLGLVQVGAQAMADRYTYVPLIGPFIALVWSAAELRPRAWPAAAAALCLLALALTTRTQLAPWRNSVTLFEHAVAVTGASHLNLAMARAERGDFAGALAPAEEALRRRPDLAEAHNTLGVVLAGLGRNAEALASFRRALTIAPDDPDALSNVGSQLALAGNTEQALDYYRRALLVDPNHARTYFNWGTTLAETGRYAEAVPYLRRAVELNPEQAEAQYNLGAAWWLSGERERGRQAILRAQALGYAVRPDVWQRLEQVAAGAGAPGRTSTAQPPEAGRD